MTSLPFLPFSKELAAAETCYQHPELPYYVQEPFDIRVSLNNESLEESFYISVDDPLAAQQSIAYLLQEYVLNSKRANNLDLLHAPDLLSMQQELIDLYRQVENRQLDVTLYINKAPESSPLSLDDPVDKHFSLCRFYDGSYDYRVLDLIMVFSPVPDRQLLAGIQQQGAEIFLLLRWQACREQGIPFLTLSDHNLIQQQCPTLSINLQQLFENQQELTEVGRQKWTLLLNNISRLERYERYCSVALFPLATGVPSGFDVRIQCMQAQNDDPCYLICLEKMLIQQQNLLEDLHWHQAFESAELFITTLECLQQGSHFAPELINDILKL